ncbi:MAG: hypothetical protein Q9223_007954, partial [Gallowayella weberi]
MEELKSRFTRKGGSRVAEIHSALRSTTLDTSKDIHDFAATLREHNDELAAIHPDYALRKWEMNLHFVDNLTDAYDNFTTGLLTADEDFIEIGNEMDWQTLVNKAAEVEAKSRARGARTSALKASVSNASSGSCQGYRIRGLGELVVSAHVAHVDPKYDAFQQAKRAFDKARESAHCNECNMDGHFDKDCWKQGNAEMPPHIKKRKAADQKRKEEAKKNKGDNKPKTIAAKAGKKKINACIADAKDGYHHYLDSGAGRHLSGNRGVFTSLSNMDRPVQVTGFKGNTVVTQEGTIQICIWVQGRVKTVVIHNVLFVPNLPFSLLSVKALGRKGFRSIFDEEEAYIIRKESGEVVAE